MNLTDATQPEITVGNLIAIPSLYGTTTRVYGQLENNHPGVSYIKQEQEIGLVRMQKDFSLGLQAFDEATTGDLSNYDHVKLRNYRIANRF